METRTEEQQLEYDLKRIKSINARIKSLRRQIEKRHTEIRDLQTEAKRIGLKWADHAVD